ncbi:hypothetical protein RHAA1_01294 [Aggregatibacter actinomycetemcomitans RhAA1]|nr:hypothetical protein RHAA1_01294 [Aggregatibacter actinomycetemcomitans RhAA1]
MLALWFQNPPQKTTALPTPSHAIGANYDLNHGFDGANPLE